MTNLLLLWPSIPRDAVDLAASESFDDIRSLTNLIGGERRNIGELVTASSWTQTIEYQLRSGTTQMADYVGIARADLLQSAISKFKVQTSTVSYFTPLTLSGLTGWWDANRNITKNSSDVAIWGSCGGSPGGNFAQTTAASQPAYSGTWAGNGYNNYITPAAAEYLAGSMLASTLFTSTAFCFWVVCICGPNGSTQSIFGEHTNQYIRLHETNARVITATINDGAAKTATSGTLTAGSLLIIEVRYDGTNLYLNVNGSETSATAGNPTSLNWNPNISNSSNGYQAGIFEIITCNNVPSASERYDVRLYLTERYSGLNIAYLDSLFWSQELTGPNETEFIDSTAIGYNEGRFWWVSYLPLSLTKLKQSKLWLCDALDLNKDPDFIIDRAAEVTDVFVADSGAVKMARAKQPLYTFTMTWKGITDAKLREFEDAIALNAHKDGVILYTAAQHQILDEKGAVHCRILSAESRQSGQIANYNELRVVFQEMEG